jgi:putative flavoprotein involved in K+ transport
MTEEVEVAVVGAGQAGLALSYELCKAGLGYVILERGRVGETWRGRWDSFCLVIPNWTVQLPGAPYNAREPHGFMRRDEIVSHLASYADSFSAPVRAGVTVTGLESDDRGRFVLHTSAGDLHARQVVVASGAYQRPYRPPSAGQLPPSILAIDAESYIKPEALPPGEVLVVGSGQTGCQLAEELRESGRRVHLACGRAPWMPRRLDGRDTVAWLVETPFFDAMLTDLPSPSVRLRANPQVSGRNGGHDLNYRTLQALGVTLLGHFVGVAGGQAQFAPDLADSVAFGDRWYADLRQLIADSCAARAVRAPDLQVPPPFAADPVVRLNLGKIGAVIFTCGFRPDYTSWIRFPQAFDELGFPIQRDGSSTVVRGLHFMGVHFQRKRKSATFLGVAEDAAVLAQSVVSQQVYY